MTARPCAGGNANRSAFLGEPSFLPAHPSPNRSPVLCGGLSFGVAVSPRCR
jgi:hypothetical protein